MIPSVSDSLKNQFLIATPQHVEGLFKSSVTYICEHNDDGAMGVIINRPSNLMVPDILDNMAEDELHVFDTQPVLLGGPVGTERGFVLHQTLAGVSRWDSSLQITEDIALTGSKDILTAISEGRGPKNFLVVLGYAGWGAGQLEQELAENAWITSPAQTEILFTTPFHKRAKAAAKLLGIDLSALALHAGTA